MADTNENGRIRAHVNIMMAHALVAFAWSEGWLSTQHRDQLRAAGLDRERILMRMVLGVEYLCRHHRHHPQAVQPVWGHSSWSAFWSGLGVIGPLLVWDDLPPETQTMLRNLPCSEADRIAGTPPGSAMPGNTQLEENCSQTGALAAAIAMNPSHPHSGSWRAALKRYAMNTLSHPQDRASTQMIGGHLTGIAPDGFRYQPAGGYQTRSVALGRITPVGTSGVCQLLGACSTEIARSCGDAFLAARQGESYALTVQDGASGRRYGIQADLSSVRCPIQVHLVRGSASAAHPLEHSMDAKLSTYAEILEDPKDSGDIIMDIDPVPASGKDQLTLMMITRMVHMQAWEPLRIEATSITDHDVERPLAVHRIPNIQAMVPIAPAARTRLRLTPDRKRKDPGIQISELLVFRGNPEVGAPETVVVNAMP